MNDDWIRHALGDGWLLKVLTGLGVVLGAAIGWAARRPLEKSGVLAVINAAVQAQFKRLTVEIDHVTARCEKAEARCEAAEAGHEKCEADLAEVRREIAEYMARPIPPYVNPKASRRRAQEKKP